MIASGDEPRGYPRPPDLQALVAQYGTYSNIPAEAWAAFDAAMRDWHIARRIHTGGQYIEDRLKPEKKRRTKRA